MRPIPVETLKTAWEHIKQTLQFGMDSRGANCDIHDFLPPNLPHDLVAIANWAQDGNFKIPDKENETAKLRILIGNLERQNS
jgi:hypothetical protein